MQVLDFGHRTAIRQINNVMNVLQLQGGRLSYVSRLGAAGVPVNMTAGETDALNDGRWHSLTLTANSKALSLFVDGTRVADELDPAGVHDFLDAYLNTITLGGVLQQAYHASLLPPSTYLNKNLGFSSRKRYQLKSSVEINLA